MRCCLLLVSGIVVCLAGCGAPQSRQVAGGEHDLPPELQAQNSVPASELAVTEFMVHVFEHNAEQMWAWQAEIIDESGSRLTAPTNDDEWHEAESDALTLAELSHELMGSALRIDDPRWDQFASLIHDQAKAAAAAAEEQNTEVWMQSGEQIADTCKSCHYQFAPHLEYPRN